MTGKLILHEDRSKEKFIEFVEITNKLFTWVTGTPAPAEKILKKINKGKKDNMRYYIPRGCSFFQRKDDNRWVGHIMENGMQRTVACRADKKFV